MASHPAACEPGSPGRWLLGPPAAPVSALSAGERGAGVRRTLRRPGVECHSITALCRSRIGMTLGGQGEWIVTGGSPSSSVSMCFLRTPGAGPTAAA